MNPFRHLSLQPNPYDGRYRVFRQNSMLRKLPEDDPARQGVCRALCLAYAGLAKIGSNIGHATGKGSELPDMWEGALLKYAVKMQNTIDVGGASDVFTASIQTTKTSGKAVSLRVLEGECKTYQWNCLDEIARQVTGLTSSGKHFHIFLPSHVVAARMSQNGSTFLFDPNFGEARVPRNKFRAVLGLTLGHPTIQTKYHLNAGTDIYVIATY